MCAEDSSLCVILTTRNGWACVHLSFPLFPRALIILDNYAGEPPKATLLIVTMDACQGFQALVPIYVSGRDVSQTLWVKILEFRMWQGQRQAWFKNCELKRCLEEAKDFPLPLKASQRPRNARSRTYSIVTRHYCFYHLKRYKRCLEEAQYSLSREY